MNILVIILLAIAGIIALFLIIALFVSKELNVERSITINRSKDAVFNYIKFLKNQDNFSKWGKLDPDMKKDYTGTDGTVGFVSAWEGNKKVGKGEQEITKITDGARVDFDLRFIKPFRSQADAYMTTEAAGDQQTQVKWGFKSQMRYPSNIMKVFMNMDKMVGNDFSTGLGNLKNILEQQP